MLLRATRKGGVTALFFLLLFPFNVNSATILCTNPVITTSSCSSAVGWMYTGMESWVPTANNTYNVSTFKGSGWSSFSESQDYCQAASYTQFIVDYNDDGSNIGAGQIYGGGGKVKGNASSIEQGDSEISLIDFKTQCLEGPDPCDEADRDPVTECGSIESVIWDDADTCSFHCEECDDSFEEAALRCGSGYEFDNSDCTYTCDDCPETNCEFGTIWIDESTCDFECVEDCNESFDVCYNECYPRGGISNHACQSDAAGDIVDNTCECRFPPPEDPPVDPDPVPDPDPGVDPEDPIDPADNPPADDPASDPDDGAGGWLKAIKENTDTIVDQLDDDAERQEEHTSLLTANAENTKAIAGNTVAINESVIGVGNKVDGMNSNLGTKLDGVVEAIEGIEGTDLTNVETKLDTLIENTGTPDDFDPNFDNTLDDVIEGNESDLMDVITEAFTDVDGVSSEDVGFFETLKSSIFPPSSTCVPLDLSVRGHVLIVGCEYESEVKAIMGYFIYIITIIIIFQLVRKELVPKSSAG